MKSGSRIVKKKILLLLLTKNRIKTDGNLNMFSQCLGQEETETKMYPAGFYLVKPFHLLNKDVLNKDNLSSNEASAWCECGDAAPRPTPGAGALRSRAEPCRAGLRSEPVGETRLREEQTCEKPGWSGAEPGGCGELLPPARPVGNRVLPSCLRGVEVFSGARKYLERGGERRRCWKGVVWNERLVRIA